MIGVVQGTSYRMPASRDVVRSGWAKALITVTWMWVVVPRLVQTMTAPKYRGSVGVESIPYSALASLSLQVLTLAVVGLCLLIIVDTYRDPQPLSVGPLVLMVAPWLYVVVRDLYTGHSPTITALAYLLVVVALWMLRPGMQELGWLGALVGVAALVSVLLAFALPSKGIFHTSLGTLVEADKATLPIGIVVGIFTHGNTLGQFLALGLPFVALIRRRGLRATFLALTILALVGSASRGAIGAAALAGLAALCIRPMSRPTRKALGPIVALLPFGVVVALPLLTHDPMAFANRGFIWAVSLEWWREAPWFGLGTNWYAEVGRTSERVASTVFHGHNQFVQLAVTGGVAMLVLFTLQFVTLAVRAGRLAAAGHGVGVAYLAGLAGACLLEKAMGYVDATAVFPVVVVPLSILMFTVLPEAAATGRDLGQAAPRMSDASGRTGGTPR